MSLTLRPHSPDASALSSANAFSLSRDAVGTAAGGTNTLGDVTGTSLGGSSAFLSEASRPLMRTPEAKSTAAMPAPSRLAGNLGRSLPFGNAASVVRRSFAPPSFPTHALNWLPGMVLPLVLTCALLMARRFQLPVPALGETLLFAIVLASLSGTRASTTAFGVSVGVYAYQLWPYLVTGARPLAFWRLGWFGLSAFAVLGALEILRWRGRAEARSGAQLRRELLQAFQKHERSAAEMACVLEQVADGIMICDPEGQVTFANARARGLHGVAEEAPAQLVGRDCRFATLEGASLPRIELPLARAAQGETVPLQEWLVRRADGSKIVAQGSATPVCDHEGTLLGAVATLRDVSVQRREVVALESANRIKTEFLSVLSHELRTPLTPILGWVTLLRSREAATKNPAIMHEALEAIERNALSQKRLIDDLIDAISLLSGELKMSRVPALLAPILKECVSEAQNSATVRDIKIHLDCGSPLPPLILDEPRFAQAVRHLLSNAVKFSHDGGIITLRACYRPEVNLEEDGSGVVTLDIIDRGEGIAPEIMPYIFELFRQGDGSETRRHDGLGVGLTVARTITEMHGGDLSAYSEGEGYGARFTLIMPVPEVPTT